jgi:hypothetical protein
MPRFELRYSPARTPSPVSFWVHRAADPALDAEGWIRADRHHPPMPPAVAGRGFPNLYVEVGERELHFASSVEVRHVIEILSRNPLPTTRALSRARHATAGPNQHWLARLPGELRSSKRRQQLVKLLERALEAVGREGAGF